MHETYVKLQKLLNNFFIQKMERIDSTDGSITLTAEMKEMTRFEWRVLVLSNFMLLSARTASYHEI